MRDTASSGVISLWGLSLFLHLDKTLLALLGVVVVTSEISSVAAISPSSLKLREVANASSAAEEDILIFWTLRLFDLSEETLKSISGLPSEPRK